MSSLSNTIKYKSKALYSKLLNEIVKLPNKYEYSNISIASRIFAILISFLWNGLILYYITNLEDASCECILDWRHEFIKKVAYLNIIISFLPIIMTYINVNEIITILFGLFIIIINAINIYEFFTYIGDLNSSQCKCAVINQPLLNAFYNDKRYYILILYILGIITIITEINLSISININDTNYVHKI
jgi:hypothetical protein